MARLLVRVEVRLREGLVDPEGRTVKEALSGMGFPVLSARAGKAYRLEVEAPGPREAEALAREMCSALLANPVRDECEVEVLEVGARHRDER